MKKVNPGRPFNLSWVYSPFNRSVLYNNFSFFSLYFFWTQSSEKIKIPLYKPSSSNGDGRLELNLKMALCMAFLWKRPKSPFDNQQQQKKNENLQKRGSALSLFLALSTKKNSKQNKSLQTAIRLFCWKRVTWPILKTFNKIMW